MNLARSTLEYQPLQSGTSDRGFLIDLYLEHLEEASFLYEQRLSLLDDPELTWRDLNDFEERFEAHVDALVLGEELALTVSLQQALEGDFGELHTAVRVFCRQDRMALFNEVLEVLDADDEERITAVSDALCHEMPEGWSHPLIARLRDGDALLTRIVARPLGYRRVPASEVLIDILPSLQETLISDAVWSLGRIRDPSARPILYKKYLQHDSEETQASAALALLRLGEPATTGYCADAARSRPWALLPIGLGGGWGHLGLLMDVAASETVDRDCMLALGLLGDISAVEPLLYHLSEESLAEGASVAMYLITGADLFEDVLIPESIDEDELFDDERLELEAGGNGTAASAASRGTTIRRISQDPNSWREWWAANKASFRSGVRYRNGQPYGPDALLQNLADEQSPRIVRLLAAEELVIRYACDVVFEPDMSVVHQAQTLARIESWFEGRSGKFKPGSFYLAGNRQSN